MGMLLFAVVPCDVQELNELVLPVLPGSEQFRLQQTRAIDAPVLLLWAFLQQSGNFDIGQVPSC
jgi:hypothetical protein